MSIVTIIGNWVARKKELPSILCPGAKDL